MASILNVNNVKKSYRMGMVLVPALRGVTFNVRMMHAACMIHEDEKDFEHGV